MKPIVIIESPFRGGPLENLTYAREALAHSLAHGEAPFASHLLYTQVLDDKNPLERSLGMNAGFAFQLVAQRVAVYADLGISAGMEDGIAAARARGLPIEYRYIRGGST